MDDLNLIVPIIIVAVLVIGGLAGFVVSRRGGDGEDDGTSSSATATRPPAGESPTAPPDTVADRRPADLPDVEIPDTPEALYPPDEDDLDGPSSGVGTLVPPGEGTALPEAPVEPSPPVTEPVTELTAFERFTLRLTKARTGVGTSLAGVFRRGVDEQAFEDLEEQLIAADVGVDAALELVEGLRNRCREEGVKDGAAALGLLKEVMILELSVADRSMARRAEGPTTWMFTGVNGTGKTTSIGKLAAKHTRAGDAVVLAAADTFRAAAAEQLELWGERAGARVVRSGEGADPAAVAFDGFAAARSAGADILMVDTAGRLQNKTALMDELSKVKRVLERDAGPTDEVLLVLDATTGQNGLSQAKAFTDAVDVSGVVLTKLDGTSRGGIVVAIQRALGIPVKLVGLGEGIDDLADFDPEAFVEALFAEGEHDIELD